MTSSVSERLDNVVRCLRSVAATYGKIIASQLAVRHGWTLQSTARYLRALEDAGYVEAVDRKAGRPCAWRITPAGTKWLQDVTAGLDGASLDSHPATHERTI